MRKEMTKRMRTHLLIALVTLGLHYLVLALALILTEGAFSFSGLGALIRERLTMPGDAVRYLDLAENGYVREGENAINLVFFPLYPLIVRALSFFTGDLALSGLIVSQTAYAGASILLYEWIRLDGDEGDAWFGVLLMALYPFSVFVMGVYSEGLFLLLSILCLYFIRRQRFAAAGMAGFFAALCRVQGVLLFLPAVYQLITLRFGEEKRRLRPADACALLIPAGFGVYLLINLALHGDPFRFLQYEAGEPWFQTSRWISANIADQFAMGREYTGLSWIIYYPQIIFYFLALITLGLGIVKKRPTAEILYGGAYLGFTYLSGWMISGGRYLLACVPLYGILSRFRSAAVKRLLLLFFALLHVVYSLLFYMSYAIM